MLVCLADVIILRVDFGVFVSERHIVVVCEMDHNVVVSVLVGSHFRIAPEENFVWMDCVLFLYGDFIRRQPWS